MATSAISQAEFYFGFERKPEVAKPSRGAVLATRDKDSSQATALLEVVDRATDL